MFNMRRPGYEGRALVARRRADSIIGECRQLATRSTFLRRLWCLLGGHAFCRTGLALYTPNGTACALVVCSRCGRKWADPGEDLRQEVTP
jgi:hypothetical protein